MMGGEGSAVEVDETDIGGLARNMHKDLRKRRFNDSTAVLADTAVFGLLDRKGGKSKFPASSPENWRREFAHAIIKDHVETGTTVYSDEHGAYH